MVLMVTLLGFLLACNSSNNDSVDAAKEANDDRKDSAVSVTPDSLGMSRSDTALNKSLVPVDKKDADFAVEAANGGMMEVELGNYAQKNAMSQRVKDFGAMMARDHSKANEELKALAASKNITLPTTMGNDTHKDMEELMKKTGKDFDKAYMKMMVNDHKKDISEFEKAAKNCKDADIKGFAIKTLPVLNVHLDSAKVINSMK